MRAPKPPSFTGQLAHEARSKWGVLLAAALLIVALDAFIAWRVGSPQLQVLVALLITLVPALYWLFGGLTASWPRGAGEEAILAKYVWLLIELSILIGLLFGSTLYFLNGLVPLVEVQLSAPLVLQLAALFTAVLLVPPAIAVAASAIGRTSRLRVLAALTAFVLMWLAFWHLLSAASHLDVLGSYTLSFPQLPPEFCAESGSCYLRVNGALLALQPLFALFALWTAVRAFRNLEVRGEAKARPADAHPDQGL